MRRSSMATAKGSDSPTDGVDELTARGACGCSPLLACWTHYQDERGRPAIRHVPDEGDE